MTEITINFGVWIAVDETKRGHSHVSVLEKIDYAKDSTGKSIEAYIDRVHYTNQTSVTHNNINITEVELNRRWMEYCKLFNIPLHCIQVMDNALCIRATFYSMNQTEEFMKHLESFLGINFDTVFKLRSR